MREYYYRMDDEEIPLFCEVEFDLYENAEREDLPWLLWLFIKHSDIEDPRFKNFKEDLLHTLQQEIGAIYAGMIQKEGWCEFYFYASSAKRFENLTSDVIARNGSFAYERGTSKDTKWNLFFERLYPDDYSLLSIQNRKILESLVEAGDNSALSREIEHYLFFQTKSSLERTVSMLEAKGFSLKEKVNDDESDYSYGAVMTKVEPATPETIEETTVFLYETALQEHGLYEGWSTTLAQ